MSNNIYDILKKMAGLEAPKQSLTESKNMDTVKELHKESKKEPIASKGSIAEAVKTVESQLNEKYMGFKKTVAAIKKGGSAENPEAVAAAIGRKKYGKEKFQKAAAAGKKLGEGIADLFVDTEKMAQQKAKANQNFADRSAKHFASQVGDQYHDQLMKTNPSYRDEYMSRVRDARSPEVMRKIEKELQAKHDPMGGPTNIDYEKIKKNPMATRAGEQGVDWRPWGPGPKDYFDTDQFGRPVKEDELDESGLQAYLGKKKYGEEGMKALQKAGREGASKEKMAKIRARHDKMDEGSYNEDMLSAKQKEFAALAEPKDKITYADKIAGAKKKSMKEDSHSFSLNTPLKHAINQMAEQGIEPHIRRFFEHARDNGAVTIRDALRLANGKQHIIDAVQQLLGGDQDSVDNVKEGNKFTGNLAKARAQGLKQADLDGDGDMEPVHEGWVDDAADRAIARVNAGTARDVADEFRRSNLNPSMKSPASDKFKADLEKARAGGNKFYDTPEKEGPFKGKTPAMILSKDAEETDIAGQNKYRDRTTPGIINKAKDFIGYDKPDPAYGPKVTKEGRTSMREGWEEMQKYLEKKRGPESKGGAGKKAGSRYGGSAQKDDDEDLDGEGKPVEKKKGRPKGTGGGAKHSFKKPKD